MMLGHPLDTFSFPCPVKLLPVVKKLKYHILPGCSALFVIISYSFHRGEILIFLTSLLEKTAGDKLHLT